MQNPFYVLPLSALSAIYDKKWCTKISRFLVFCASIISTM